VCEYRKLCGGCRARPLARDANLMGEDFLCSYTPEGGAVIALPAPSPGSLDWSDDARTHLQRVPGFVRAMVRRRAEEYVRENGRLTVTSDDLAYLKRRRFGDAGPPGLARPDRPLPGADPKASP
jgi:AdoMet-dependent heme synthase